MSYKGKEKNQKNTSDVSRRSLLKRGAILGGASALASAFGLTPAHAATPSSFPRRLLS